MNSRTINRAAAFVVAIITASACATGQQSAPQSPPQPAPPSSATAQAAAPQQKLAAPEVPFGDPKNFIGAPELYALLNHATMDTAATAALSDYEYKVGTIYLDQVGDVAEDSLASVASRINALNIIAQSESPREFEPIRAALHASDPRVRAIALKTANALNPKGVLTLYREALNDPAPEIQMKALQFIGSDDIDLLRSLSADPGRSPTAITAMRTLIQAAEEWGAPIVMTDSTTGILQRTAPNGYTVRFSPATRWAQWDAAVGTVTLTSPEKKTVELRGNIEVVGNVIPAFFSPDGKYVVYEADRQIHVRDLQSGTDRDVGAGFAPRVRPLTDQFVYMTEDTTGRADLHDRLKVRYNVMSATFAAGTAPSSIGVAGGFISQEAHGAYSPARWMRVEERDGNFYLASDGLENFQLPLPGASGS